MDFQKWHAAFTSCVDVTSLSPQFEMLCLEACLTGKAAETIKGLGYSVEAYEAAKARLVRKYGGSRRQVQSHLDELKKSVARLCPLGWMAVGRIEQQNNVGHHHIGFSHTFRIHMDEPTTKDVPNECSDLNSILKRFLDLESIGIIPTRESLMTPEEKLAWVKVSKSLKFDGEHYEIVVPWKEDRPDLPSNLPMAKQRLLSTEKKLLKNKEIAVAYQHVLNDYLEKQYIRRVPKDEEKP